MYPGCFMQHVFIKKFKFCKQNGPENHTSSTNSAVSVSKSILSVLIFKLAGLEANVMCIVYSPY